MLDGLDNGRDEKDNRVIFWDKSLIGEPAKAGESSKADESCRREDMCQKNGSKLRGMDLKLGKSFVKMISGQIEAEDPSTSSPNCPDGECCQTEIRQSSRMTGSSCRALKCAVSTLHRLDDFNMEKIGSGFFSEVFKSLLASVAYEEKGIRMEEDCLASLHNFLVTHKVTGNVMVLKMNLLRSNRPNMLKEVQLMNQLKHRNILNFLGVCVHEGQLHALTEYINGGSLEQLIQSWNMELPYLMRQQLALDIARGMEYLHGKGVFHRDLTSKNVLIKKSDGGSMMAVVGDFGLAAKIPDPKCKYRLPTVGSAYWMSPECLKGQWYNEKSDIFSYGIILCEMIARIEADPDVLPRTDNFGLDYLAFSELCGPCPPHFLKLAFSCSTFEPKSRPSFAEIVKTLERLIAEYEELLKKESEDEFKIVSAASLNNLIEVSGKSGITAKSEEIINKCAATAKDIIQQRKLHHRRSLSEYVVNFAFPKHTAPSDKARCHYVTTPKNCEILANPKHIGESMCQVDPHYKPRLSGEKGSRSNPFLALSQFRGAKKILGSQNINFGKTSVESSSPSHVNSNDLFSSCFELPSPFYGVTPPSSPVAGCSLEDKGKKCCGGCSEDDSDFPVEDAESSARKCRTLPGWSNPEVSKSVKVPAKSVAFGEPETVRRDCSSEELCPDRPSLFIRNYNSDRSSFSFEPHRCASESGDETGKNGQSVSLPSSPTTRRKSSSNVDSLVAQNLTEKQSEYPSRSAESDNEKPKKLTKSRTVPALKTSDAVGGGGGGGGGEVTSASVDPEFDKKCECSRNSIFPDKMPKNAKETKKAQPGSEKAGEADVTALVRATAGRISSSSSNLLECNVDDSFLMASSVQLKRRGSCESGFFSCLGEDFPAGNDTLPSSEYMLHASRQKYLDNSSATLSSSSAASSLFLLDDSLSTTTVSSLRSGSGDFNDLDDLPNKFAHHSILFSGKRSSSVYTDSSEDISNLGDAEERIPNRYQSQQISKIVEYFERKQSGGMASRSESNIKYRKNHNIEFQRNLERFDSTDTFGNDKIKWEGLEGKFKKSGMGLTQKQNTFEESLRTKANYEVGSNGNRTKKFGPQNVLESAYHHDLSRKFDGGSVSDVIRKSKIELLRKSLEKGTLQVPGINPHVTSTAAASSNASNEKNSVRPLAMRLIICEGAVKSKLPLFDKK